MSDYLDRFGGMARLFSQPGLERLREARVAVIGLGGVGTWAAEALARSGVGGMTLVDLDEICLTNVNRQLPALDGELGRSKAQVMAERIRRIAPECQVRVRREFYSERTAPAIFAEGLAGVVDAIDSVPHKCHLIQACHSRRLPLVVCGGAGGKRDGTQVRIRDLAATGRDPLLYQVRRRLRREFGFPKGEGVRFGVDAVVSSERPVFPGEGGCVVRERPPGEDMRLNCERGFGTASFVTGAFGLAAAGRLVERLAASEETTPESSR
ncbi:MAG: tRNA threonylcarbamoyladenosine dehydratase [Verrucomicrobiota bacterium]